MSKDYKLEIAFNQSTLGSEDNTTLTTELSEDPSIHLIKTKVFSKHLTAALDAITQELCDLGLDALSVEKLDALSVEKGADVYKAKEVR
jgi:hypothetical protein